MVAKIETGHSLRRTFYYNENKVNDGVASCIHSENYPMDHENMSEQHRLNMLVKTALKNPNVKRNSVHISLNFAPGEQLSDDKLKAIATEYMEQIGFEKQPYLVYKHEDAGHPHIHIVSVKIRPDGSRIDMNNIGRNQSEQARLSLEKKYKLIHAGRSKEQGFELKSAYTPRAEYGRAATKRAIAIVLNGVLDTYKYASLYELNAVLGLYNVVAERGAEGSRTYAHKGLLYRILDSEGKPVGIPIKASLFHHKPILANLEKRFLKNDIERQKRKPATRNAIDSAIRKCGGQGLKEVVGALEKKGIDVLLRENKEGLLYGITYVDHTTGCVFNGSALGKEYSARAIQERYAGDMAAPGEIITNALRQANNNQGETYSDSPFTTTQQQDNTTHPGTDENLLETLTKVEETYGNVPYELRKKKKKKRRGL